MTKPKKPKAAAVEFSVLLEAKRLEEAALKVLHDNMEYGDDGLVQNDAAFKIIELSLKLNTVH